GIGGVCPGRAGLGREQGVETAEGRLPVPVGSVVENDRIGRFEERSLGTRCPVEAGLAGDRGRASVEALELMLAMPQPASSLGQLLRERLEVEGMKPWKVDGVTARIVVEIAGSDDPERVVECGKELAYGQPTGTVGKLVGVEPQPPDVPRAVCRRNLLHNLVHD